MVWDYAILCYKAIYAFNTYRAAWFRQFSKKNKQFLVALPTP